MNFFPAQYQISAMTPHGLYDKQKPAVGEIISVLARYDTTYYDAKNILGNVLKELEYQKVDFPMD